MITGDVTSVLKRFTRGQLVWFVPSSDAFTRSLLTALSCVSMSSVPGSASPSSSVPPPLLSARWLACSRTRVLVLTLPAVGRSSAAPTEAEPPPATAAAAVVSPPALFSSLVSCGEGEGFQTCQHPSKDSARDQRLGGVCLERGGQKSAATHAPRANWSPRYLSGRTVSISVSIPCVPSPNPGVLSHLFAAEAQPETELHLRDKIRTNGTRSRRDTHPQECAWLWCALRTPPGGQSPPATRPTVRLPLPLPERRCRRRRPCHTTSSPIRTADAALRRSACSPA